MSVQKTYPIPVELLQAAFGLIERMPASREVRAVLNGIEAHCNQHDQELQASTMGGGGAGNEETPPKKPA